METTIGFHPTLQAQHDDPAAIQGTEPAELFAGLLADQDKGRHDRRPQIADQNELPRPHVELDSATVLEEGLESRNHRTPE